MQNWFWPRFFPSHGSTLPWGVGGIYTQQPAGKWARGEKEHLFSQSPLPRSDTHLGDVMPGLGWVERGGVLRYVTLACRPVGPIFFFFFYRNAPLRTAGLSSGVFSGRCALRQWHWHCSAYLWQPFFRSYFQSNSGTKALSLGIFVTLCILCGLI